MGFFANVFAAAFLTATAYVFAKMRWTRHALIRLYEDIKRGTIEAPAPQFQFKVIDLQNVERNQFLSSTGELIDKIEQCLQIDKKFSDIIKAIPPSFVMIKNSIGELDRQIDNIANVSRIIENYKDENYQYYKIIERYLEEIDRFCDHILQQIIAFKISFEGFHTNIAIFDEEFNFEHSISQFPGEVIRNGVLSGLRRHIQRINDALLDFAHQKSS